MLLRHGNVDELRSHHKVLSDHLQKLVDSISVMSFTLDKVPIDPISMSLIPDHAIDSSASDQVPSELATKPNGDCLYNATSLLIFGNESLSYLLRDLVSIELYLFRTYYVDHPYIVAKQSVISNKSLFECCLKSLSTESASRENAIINEVISICDAHAWSSMICILLYLVP